MCAMDWTGSRFSGATSGLPKVWVFPQCEVNGLAKSGRPTWAAQVRLMGRGGPNIRESQTFLESFHTSLALKP